MRTTLVCIPFLVFGFCMPTAGQCHAPVFHVGQDFSNPEQGIGSLSVSLRPKDFTVEKLSCLCRKLSRENPKWETAGVEIFTTREAAGNMSHMLGPEEPPEARQWLREHHASYSFSKSTHQEQLTLLPLGLHSPATLKTVVNLPITTATHCQMEIGNRCVMVALEEISYPQEALTARAGGKVTLAGVIDRKGAIRQIRTVSVDVHPNDGNALANAALHDLATWRFDSGNHNDAVQIVYSFEITAPDPFHLVETSVSFSPPNEVDIRVRPLGSK